MAEGKNKIVVYADWLENFEDLTDEELGKLMRHFFEYVNDLNPKLEDRLLKIAWKPIESTLKRDLKKWESYVDKQKANGKKGGRPKTQKSQAFISKPKKAVSDSVRVRVRVSDSDSDTDVNKIPMSEIKISDLEENKIEFFEIANAFRELFIKNLNESQAPTNHQENAKFKNYVDPIRLMIQNDGVTKEQLTTVFKFLDSPAGSFWKPNILSTAKLREKLPQLLIKSQTNEQHTNNHQPTINRQTADTYRKNGEGW